MGLSKCSQTLRSRLDFISDCSSRLLRIYKGHLNVNYHCLTERAAASRRLIQKCYVILSIKSSLQLFDVLRKRGAAPSLYRDEFTAAWLANNANKCKGVDLSNERLHEFLSPCVTTIYDCSNWNSYMTCTYKSRPEINQNSRKFIFFLYKTETLPEILPLRMPRFKSLIFFFSCILSP